MAYLGTYIRQLLSNREQVVLPGFGSLIVTKGEGGVQDSGLVEPPVPVLRFDPAHPKGDGKLAGVYAAGENIDTEEARQQVLELVDAIKFRLDKGEKYKLAEVGVFSRDDDNRIHFTKDPGWMIDPDAFGLDTLEILELESDVSDETGNTEDNDRGVRMEVFTEGKEAAASGSAGRDAMKGNRGSAGQYRRKPVNKWKIIWIVVGSLIAVLVLILLIPTRNGVEFGREGIVIRDTEEAGGDGRNAPEAGNISEGGENQFQGAGPAEVKEPAADQPGDQPQENRYFIIAGSFQNLQNATELMNELSAMGFHAEIIFTENRLYRVSVKSFSERDQAIRELPKIRTESGMDGAWVMTR